MINVVQGWRYELNQVTDFYDLIVHISNTRCFQGYDHDGVKHDILNECNSLKETYWRHIERLIWS